MDAEDFNEIIKVVVIGDSASGKTCAIRYYAYHMFSAHTKTTIGLDFAEKFLLRGERKIRLQLWDIAGVGAEAMTHQYYESASGVAVICKIDCPRSFDAAIRWKEDVEGKLSLVLPSVLIVNQCDLETDCCLSEDELDEFCLSHGFQAWFKTSAKTGNNIYPAFDRLLDEILPGPSTSVLTQDTVQTCLAVSLSKEESSSETVTQSITTYLSSVPDQGHLPVCCHLSVARAVHHVWRCNLSKRRRLRDLGSFLKALARNHGTERTGTHVPVMIKFLGEVSQHSFSAELTQKYPEDIDYYRKLPNLVGEAIPSSGDLHVDRLLIAKLKHNAVLVTFYMPGDYVSALYYFGRRTADGKRSDSQEDWTLRPNDLLTHLEKDPSKAAESPYLGHTVILDLNKSHLPAPGNSPGNTPDKHLFCLKQNYGPNWGDKGSFYVEDLRILAPIERLRVGDAFYHYDFSKRLLLHEVKLDPNAAHSDPVS